MNGNTEVKSTANAQTDPLGVLPSGTGIVLLDVVALRIICPSEQNRIIEQPSQYRAIDIVHPLDCCKRYMCFQFLHLGEKCIQQAVIHFNHQHTMFRQLCI